MVLNAAAAYQNGYAAVLHDMYAHDVLSITEAFGQIITEAKEAKGMTFEQLAAASGLAIMTVKRLSYGERTPDVEQLAKLGRALGVDPLGWFREAERRVQASNRHG
jgi:ribosome-binding protein aMBF1 (putative translation factor)